MASCGALGAPPGYSRVSGDEGGDPSARTGPVVAPPCPGQEAPYEPYDEAERPAVAGTPATCL
eukprot:14050971-Alexandrium_andersonii.AAC.1